MDQVAEHSPVTAPGAVAGGRPSRSGGEKTERDPAGPGATEVVVRRARTPDVRAIRRLVDTYGGAGPRLLEKATVTLYEDIQEFWVATDGAGRVVGCGALHVLWEDLAEIRTVAVDPDCRGMGIGHRIVSALIRTAVELGLRRVFCLTFEVDFFARHGFREIQGTPVSPEVYAELLASYDEGVAEFLDLEHVKPNTLGNTRMLLHLTREPDFHDGGADSVER
ncbi:amino-acid N-acetyltransferase [Streptosporangium becharense]|uniref:Amino-acid N-acetyltransferase n=1 Tax=Streptosporangium becharense TaxID=1816182 RepID=A0A7W9IH26_9ACTN|nr:amino-acid N-acetyltransferase [Streptosporangium becharense]MBB2912546.1 amino-acid N-acetyltransferase [Streptosporangium becharense]MBB5820624.1 amino-acid N-acetyltransferase [Streptosporangium becharense]